MTRWIAALGAVAIMAVACGSEPATPTAVSDDATPDQTTADIDVPSTMLPTTTVRSATTIEATTVATQPTTVTTSATTAPTTTGPATTPTTSPGLTSPAILRPDGLGPFAFGTPADQVQAWLAGELGEPDTTAVEGSGGWPLESCNERRFSYWASAGFVVGFTDLLSYDSDAGVANCDDVPHLEAWYVTEYAQPWFYELGADLTVDGVFGPRTDAALAVFQSKHGIEERGVGPITLKALGVDVPDDASIVYLRAGDWDFDF